MEDLIILGTSVHAAEMADIVARANLVRPIWKLLGCLAFDERQRDAAGKALNGMPVLGTRDALPSFGTARFVADNTWPVDAEVPMERLVSLVDPSTFVARSARIGRGCVVYPHCTIGHNAVLGERVFCLSGCVVNHDDVVADRTQIASQVSLAGYVTVESGCYLGQSCSVRQNVTIGNGSFIGMGAIVLHDVPPNSVMVGNPARKLRDRT